MKTGICTGILSISLLFSPTGRAQTTLQHREPQPSDYVLGAGDQVVLHVSDLDDISDKPIRIDPNGYIDLPLAGPVQAGGLTLDQFKAALAAKLSKYITSPQISVNLTENQSRPVSVLGAVNNPGVHQLQGPRHLLEVISLSGGIRPDAGSTIIVTRQPRFGAVAAPGAKVTLINGYSTANFSLDNLMSSKDPQDNILIEPGDVVSIPKADLIYVVGDVRRAGGFPLSSHKSVSLLQAVSLAEGLGPNASSKHARILRPAPDGDGTPHEIAVDVGKIFAGKAPDVPLYANDVLFIPNSLIKQTAGRALDATIGVTTGLLIYRH